MTDSITVLRNRLSVLRDDSLVFFDLAKAALDDACNMDERGPTDAMVTSFAGATRKCGRIAGGVAAINGENHGGSSELTAD